MDLSKACLFSLHITWAGGDLYPKFGQVFNNKLTHFEPSQFWPNKRLFFGLCSSRTLTSPLLCSVKHNNPMTTFNGGSLGSCIDEERSQLRYVMWIAEFSESSNFWTQIALPGIPGSMSAWVSSKPILAQLVLFAHARCLSLLRRWGCLEPLIRIEPL